MEVGRTTAGEGAAAGCDMYSAVDSLCTYDDVVGSAYRCDRGQCVFSDPTTCNELGMQAKALLATAAQSVDQCATDQDCTPLDDPPPCWAECGSGLAGNQATRDAVAAQSAAVARICDRFHRSGCEVLPPSCPPVAGRLRCDQGRCVFAL